MAQVNENTALLEQKHILLRRLEKKEITPEQCESAIDPLDRKILQNTIAYMNRTQAEIRAEIPILKDKTQKQMKEMLSEVLLRILSDVEPNIKKGALRVAYKKCKGESGDDDE